MGSHLASEAVKGNEMLVTKPGRHALQAPGRSLSRRVRRLPDVSRQRGFRTDDDGMSTVEYAIGTIAAAAFAVVLYTVVTGDSVVSALTGVIERAISVKP
jgi:hypothetical protein